MYVNIGSKDSLALKLIVAVLDLDACTGGRDIATRDFLSRAEQDGHLYVIEGDLPRSIVITLSGTYLSPVSAETLRQRIASAKPFRASTTEDRVARIRGKNHE